MEKITALQSFDFTSSLEKMSQVYLKEKAKWGHWRSFKATLSNTEIIADSIYETWCNVRSQ